MEAVRVEQVAVDDGVIEVRAVGTGRLVVMVPSAGRGATDFDDLAVSVAAAGHRVVCPEPRGIAGTTAPLDGLTMTVLASDTAAVIRACATSGAPAVVVGHAFGNRVARMTATEFPDLVDEVVLLACGGMVAPSESASAALQAVFDESLPSDEHLAHVATAFFAHGNDPEVWADGWYPSAAFVQGVASREQSVEHWWGAGRARVLVVQPADDVIAPIGNAHAVVERLGDRAELVVIERAGHALLPEQPAAVAAAVIDWLG